MTPDLTNLPWVLSGIAIALLGLYAKRDAAKVRKEIATDDREQSAQDKLVGQLMARIDQMERQFNARDDELEGARERLVVLAREVEVCNHERQVLSERLSAVERELESMKKAFIGYTPA
ncbi:MAG: hypothetical protein ABL993_02615 [Vicinamibacterales bacterium]